MQSRHLYVFIAAVVFLLLGLLAWAAQDPFEGVSYWGIASAVLGVLLTAYGVWMSWERIQGGMSRRSTRTGLQVGAMVLIVFGILAVVELVSYKHYTRWDLTPGKFFSLSPKTRKILQRVDREKRRIEFVAFTQKQARPAVRSVLEQYAHLTKQVTFRFVDLDVSPGEAKKYDVDAYGTIVVVHHFGEKEKAEAEKAAKGTAPASGKDKKKKKKAKTFRSEKIYDLLENAVANAILKTIQTAQKKVYFLTGHGERPYQGSGRATLSNLWLGMRGDNYAVDSLTLLREKGVPKDANLLIIAAPKSNYLEAEIRYLEDYIKRGGRLLVFLEPDTEGRILDFLKKFGYKIPRSIILDPQSVRFALAGGNPVTPFVMNYGVHKITEKLGGLATVYPTVRTVYAENDPKRGISTETLASTGKGSFSVKEVSLKDGNLVYDPKGKEKGPLPIASAVTVSLDYYMASEAKAKGKKKSEQAEAARKYRGKEARIVVYGDADFASDAYIGAQGNENMVFNTVNWLGGEKDLISILPKRRKGEPLILAEGEGVFVWLFTVWLVPLFILLAGAAVYVRRRQLR